MITATEVASHVSYLIETSRDQRITGVQLSALIRHKFPDFSAEIYGCTNLRDFVRRFVALAVEAGKSGADIVYGLRRLPEAPKTVGSEGADATASRVAPSGFVKPQTHVSTAVWKTFASPNSEFKLYADSQTGILEVVPPGGGQLQPPWVHIPSCSAEFHLQIARDFVASLTDHSSKSALESTLAQPGLWWRSYYAVAQQVGLTVQWNHFRARRILSELESSLKQHGVPLTGMHAATSTERSASQSARNRPAATGVAPQDSQLRSLAVEVVSSMPASELRDLKVPLGYVIDVLALKRS